MSRKSERSSMVRPEPASVGEAESPKVQTEAPRAGAVEGFDPNQTQVYQARLHKAPEWFCSFLASNNREKTRLRDELGKIKGAIALLMKPRNGMKWTPQDRKELKHMLRSVSSVSPYLFVWALPGSVLILPFLAWRLDVRRKHRERKIAKGP